MWHGRLKPTPCSGPEERSQGNRTFFLFSDPSLSLCVSLFHSLKHRSARREVKGRWTPRVLWWVDTVAKVKSPPPHPPVARHLSLNALNMRRGQQERGTFASMYMRVCVCICILLCMSSSDLTSQTGLPKHSCCVVKFTAWASHLPLVFDFAAFTRTVRV